MERQNHPHPVVPQVIQWLSQIHEKLTAFAAVLRDEEALMTRPDWSAVTVLNEQKTQLNLI